MKKLFKIIKLLRSLQGLRRPRRYAGYWAPRHYGNPYRPLAPRPSRLGEALRVLLGRRGY